jgi:hypothetical protein
MTDTVSIGGTAYPILRETLRLQRAVGSSYDALPCSFTVIDEAGAYSFQWGQPVIVTTTPDGAVWAGYIDSIKITLLSPGGALYHQIDCRGTSWLAQKRGLTTDYSGRNPECMVKAIITDVLSAEGVTFDSTSIPDACNYFGATTLFGASTIFTADEKVDVDYKNKTVADLLDYLADYRNKKWSIDEAKKLWFTLRTATAAPWTLTEDDCLTASLDKSGERYRNTEHLLNTSGVIDMVESFPGDGHSYTFTLIYPVHSKPSLKVNGVVVASGDIGINGLSTGKKWYWSKGTDTISQDYTASPLSSGSVLEVSYTGRYGQDVVVDDDTEIAARALIDGTSGIVESVDDINLVMNETGATAYATNLLTTFMASSQILGFRTRKAGLREGMNLTVNLPKLGLSNVDMFIITLSVCEDGPDSSGAIVYYYDVTAVTGPTARAWPTIFGGQ